MVRKRDRERIVERAGEREDGRESRREREDGGEGEREKMVERELALSAPEWWKRPT